MLVFILQTFTILAECDLLDILENKEIKFLQDGCGCSHGTKGGQCCQQFSEKAVLPNLNNCLKLSHRELDLVILANIEAFKRIEIGNAASHDAYVIQLGNSGRIKMAA